MSMIENKNVRQALWYLGVVLLVLGIVAFQRSAGIASVERKTR